MHITVTLQNIKSSGNRRTSLGCGAAQTTLCQGKPAQRWIRMKHSFWKHWEVVGMWTKHLVLLIIYTTSRIPNQAKNIKIHRLVCSRSGRVGKHVLWPPLRKNGRSFEAKKKKQKSLLILWKFRTHIHLTTLVMLEWGTETLCRRIRTSHLQTVVPLQEKGSSQLRFWHAKDEKANLTVILRFVCKGAPT